ncbi:glycosyltransferase [Georgenia muralis]|uniref:Glycosyltransferase involved in cell wall biosynthesis n=1 Tax=Georgenia muralis TaxID=154117 RepID=A0A3N4Z053_9MICO|nr:glycosyltransferase [Georgenia muralis]RPF25907.1 glycosyltransferase involved in cell wall biosynthesis [Georgenia muralis]
MRVVQVSAHFPPNFVSGGTLVPQRIARAVAAAGHESLVYAGYLDEERRPLETWTTTDGDVDVRWIVTTPWTAWNDPLNYLNPEVAEDFARWLEDVRPDVVHFHSLQTLGGSLVTAARDAGAKVVVTMHDFWWFCARQFLVSAELQPCSLVVSCGTCACAAGRVHLEVRDAVLAEHLAAADMVLAPSASAARVLAANGVPLDRVRVDENGVPGDPGTTTGAAGASYRSVAAGATDPKSTTGAGEPLRLMYAGGAEPLKGVDVLAEATRQLRDVAGWQLDMYGVAASPPRDLPTSVRTLEPFEPEQLASVMAAHDVLVLPSVARESHSILTREALTAGLAVVCSDTLGPEEAVDHGRNGLVVPAADPEALAAALRGLIEQPDLARAMKGQGSVTRVRTTAEQAEGLVALYRELTTVEAERRPEEGEEIDREAALQLMRKVLFVVGIQGAPLRYRAHLPAEALRMIGLDVEVRHYRDPALPHLVQEVDALVLYRVPATVQVLSLVDSVRGRERRIPVLYDVDDLIFDPSLKDQVHGLANLPENEVALWWRGVARYRTTMETADMFVGSTAELCRHATAVTGLPARRFANGVGLLLAQVSDQEVTRARAPGPLRIGYFSGTTTHDADWAAVEPAVLQVMEDHPEVELWLGGHVVPTSALEPVASRIRRLPFVPWHQLPALLRDVDVCLAPLTGDSQFNEAKSAIKWLEAALVETPVVASSTEPFREAVEHGRTGFLATSSQEWAAAVGELLDDVALRRRVGTQARRDALLRWSPHLQGEVYLENLLAAAEQVRLRGPRVPTDWEAVADDEPFSAADSVVDAYALPTGRRLVPASVVGHPFVRKLASARRVYRADGLRGVSDRTMQAVRRGVDRVR